jgi:hypothetical protein
MAKRTALMALASCFTIGLSARAEPAAVTEEEVIEDPELASAKPIHEEAPPPAGRLHVELRSRIGVDTRWENDREEVLEATEIAAFEVEHPRSKDVSFAVGLRARHFAGRRRVSGSEQDPASRYELDVVPTAAYVDATLADGWHTRVGYQVTALGRFDVFSASNILMMQDLRSGPASMPGATEIAQPAVRTDLDIGSSFTLTSVYVPFFQPDLIDIVGSDYALFAIGGSLPAAAPPPTACPAGPDFVAQAGALLQERLNATLKSSELASGSRAAFRTLAPEPNLSEPQGAMRLTARSSAGELGVTVGTALERLPTLVLSRDLRNLFADPCNPAFQADALASRGPLFEVIHPRYSVVAVDGATDIGPVQLGVEAAYFGNRTLYAGRRGVFPIPGSSDMAELALRAEFAESDFAASIEGLGAYALDDPADRDLKWMLLEDGRFFRGLSAAVGWTAGRIALELLGLATSGPTYVITPRIEWQALEQFYLELGMLVVEGPRPVALGEPETSLGGVYDGVDQVFVGARWLP